MPDDVRVFVNGSGVSVPPGSAALDAVRAFDSHAADEVLRNQQIVTDSRGLPIDASTPVAAGSILRLIPNRGAAAHDDPNDESDA